MVQQLLLFLQISPLLTLFLVIGLGYFLGQVSLLGFRLGVAGVLFAGLLVGAVCPLLNVPGMMGTFGLVLFVYSMGLQAGPRFFRNLRSRGGKYALLAAIVLCSGMAVLLVEARILHMTKEQAAGLYTGAATNTPALGVILQLAHNNLPAETYSIAYPFGVIGILLCFHLAKVMIRPKVETSTSRLPITGRNFLVTNPEVVGKTVEEIQAEHGELEFRISRIQHEGKLVVATYDLRLALNDKVVVIGSEQALKQVEEILGSAIPSRLEVDRSEIDYRRIFVSHKHAVGKTIEEFLHEAPVPCTVTRLRRGDEDFVPTAETRINFGDRLRVVAKKEALREISRYLGDSIRGTAEMNFAAVGVGLVIGVLVGMIPIPIPGFGCLRLGPGGGPLIVALILGRLERTGSFQWSMPPSANLTLRQIGLLLFMAVVGINSGPGFVHTFQKDGPAFLLGGALVTLSVSIPALFLGYKIFRIPFDELLGVVSGIHTESAAVGFASRMVSSERPEVGYTSVYPVALILKVILAQIIFRVVPF